MARAYIFHMRFPWRFPRPACSFCLALFLVMVAAWSASAGQVIIEVKEAGSAKPVEGAKVIATSDSNSVAGVTGANGLCKLDATLTSGSRMDVQKEGWCPMRWEISQA